MKKLKQNSAADAQRAVDNWRWPVGTEVIISRDTGFDFQTRTRSEPWVHYTSANHRYGEAVILVEGIAGFYLLSRVRIDKR